MTHGQPVDQRAARHRRSARTLRERGAVRTSARCPVCGRLVGLEADLIAHLEEGCRG